jgi:outer membrane protein assembly factor BamB
LLAVMALFVASACAPSRIGTAWPALANVTIQEQPRVFVTYNNWAIALNPATGKVAELLDAEGNVRVDDNGTPRKWEIDSNANGLGSAQFYSQPVLRQLEEQTQFILPTHTNKLLLVDPLTARVDNPTGEVMSGPILANLAEDENNYFIPFDNHDVAALDKASLAINWRFVTTAGVWSSPVYANGVVYFATIDHNVYAVDAADGTLIWDAPVNTGGLVGAAPLVADGFVYVGNTLDKLVKIDAATGELVTETKLKNWVWSTPVLADGTLYATDLSGWVYALDPNDLSVVWEVQANPRGIRPSPLVTESFVIVAARDGKVHWLNRASGEIAFVREIEGAPEVLSELLLVPANEAAGINEPLVLVASLNMSHLVVAFSEETATQRWVYAR